MSTRQDTLCGPGVTGDIMTAAGFVLAGSFAAFAQQLLIDLMTTTPMRAAFG